MGSTIADKVLMSAKSDKPSVGFYTLHKNILIKPYAKWYSPIEQIAGTIFAPVEIGLMTAGLGIVTALSAIGAVISLIGSLLSLSTNFSEKLNTTSLLAMTTIVAATYTVTYTSAYALGLFIRGIATLFHSKNSDDEVSSKETNVAAMAK